MHPPNPSTLASPGANAATDFLIMKISMLFSCCFLFYSLTSLIALSIRQSQLRMFFVLCNVQVSLNISKKKKKKKSRRRFKLYQVDTLM